MVKKLASLLTDRTAWKLALEAVAFSLFLWWGAFGKAGFWFWALLFAFLLWIYLREQPERRRTRILYWFFPLLSVLGLRELLGFFPESAWVAWVAVGLALYFLFLLGVTSFYTKRREFVYSLLSTTVFFLVGVWAFGVNTEFEFSSAFFLLSAVTLLFRDALGFFDVAGRRRAWILSVAVAVLAVELGFFLKFLPLGFLNAAALVALFLFLVRDALITHFRGRLDLPFIFRELAFFVGVSIVVFAGSRWII